MLRPDPGRAGQQGQPRHVQAGAARPVPDAAARSARSAGGLAEAAGEGPCCRDPADARGRTTGGHCRRRPERRRAGAAAGDRGDLREGCRPCDVRRLGRRGRGRGREGGGRRPGPAPARIDRGTHATAAAGGLTGKGEGDEQRTASAGGSAQDRRGRGDGKLREALARKKKTENHEQELREAFMTGDVRSDVMDRVNAAVRNAAQQNRSELGTALPGRVLPRQGPCHQQWRAGVATDPAGAGEEGLRVLRGESQGPRLQGPGRDHQGYPDGNLGEVGIYLRW